MTPIPLTDAVYRDLNSTARHLLARERPGHIFQPEALVHEAWLRLASRTAWQDGIHFRAAASRHMRNILIDQGRRNASAKHRAHCHVALDDACGVFVSQQLPLPEILEHFRRGHPLAARVVELKVFVGLTIPEIGRALRSLPSKIRKAWAFAKSWLRERVR